MGDAEQFDSPRASPKPVQFRISALLIATAVCAALFAVPGGVCAAPFLVATLAAYVYGVRTGRAEAASTRLKLALVTAVLVFVLTNWAGWLQAVISPETFLFYSHGDTDYRLKSTREVLENYHRAHGRYPDSLQELPGDSVILGRAGNSQFIDNWSNPIHYQRTSTGYELLSFSRDGKLGGFGLDADLDGKNPIPAPTLRQYFIEMDVGLFVPMAAMLASGISFALFYSATLRARGQSVSRSGLLIYLVGIVAVSVWIAVSLAMMHAIPSGH